MSITSNWLYRILREKWKILLYSFSKKVRMQNDEWFKYIYESDEANTAFRQSRTSERGSARTMYYKLLIQRARVGCGGKKLGTYRSRRASVETA